MRGTAGSSWCVRRFSQVRHSCILEDIIVRAIRQPLLHYSFLELL